MADWNSLTFGTGNWGSVFVNEGYEHPTVYLGELKNYSEKMIAVKQPSLVNGHKGYKQLVNNDYVIRIRLCTQEEALEAIRNLQKHQLENRPQVVSNEPLGPSDFEKQ